MPVHGSAFLQPSLPPALWQFVVTTLWFLSNTFKGLYGLCLITTLVAIYLAVMLVALLGILFVVLEVLNV